MYCASPARRPDSAPPLSQHDPADPSGRSAPSNCAHFFGSPLSCHAAAACGPSRLTCQRMADTRAPTTEARTSAIRTRIQRIGSVDVRDSSCIRIKLPEYWGTRARANAGEVAKGSLRRRGEDNGFASGAIVTFLASSLQCIRACSAAGAVAVAVLSRDRDTMKRLRRAMGNGQGLRQPRYCGQACVSRGSGDWAPHLVCVDTAPNVSEKQSCLFGPSPFQGGSTEARSVPALFLADVGSHRARVAGRRRAEQRRRH
ncbi:hypothetical protein CALCODRAFT_108003 [Calocera cornea HHB12733]|uniref:Uncharacterized protein n=1 Tax=Calocera cornea HHB12733 TaxID=1353952 RepID=A0A165IGK6_9BASI|nr:hypothetical protein CALCODRAFT_108003 [Calocera cornea HHB12733]